ncbi:MAG: M28 family peptidase [Pseudomonadota bacterium]
MKQLRWLWLLAVGLLVACADPAEPRGEVRHGADIDVTLRDAAQLISPERIEGHIRELSADAYEGRAPGTAGDRKTQDYLVAQLEALGLEPGMPERRWLQPFGMVGLNTTQPATWDFSGSQGDLSFAQNSEFIVATGVQSTQVAVEDADVVFVGYGIQAPEYGWDDYKDVDVRDKILVMLNSDPALDPALFGGEARLYYGRWTYKYEIAAQLGAAGVIIVHTDLSAGYPWRVVQTSWSGPQFELPNEGQPTIALKAWMTEAAIQRLFGAAQLDWPRLVAAAQRADFNPVAIGMKTSMRLTVERSVNESANVLAVLPGSDLELTREAVIYTAHHDHLGVNPQAGLGEDAIYNGALDNASGVASILEIARVFSTLRVAPKRSIVFAFVGAEEQGLLGSSFYAHHPTFAPGRIAANVNMDGGQNFGRTHDIEFIGFGRSDVDEIAWRVAGYQGRVVVGDPDPSSGYFYRSDHFSLARIGVPSLNFRGGSDLLEGGRARGAELRRRFVTEHYHQPSDEVTADWRFDGFAEDAQFGFLSGALMANAEQMRRWRAGDEFEAARMQALAERN